VRKGLHPQPDFDVENIFFQQPQMQVCNDQAKKINRNSLRVCSEVKMNKKIKLWSYIWYQGCRQVPKVPSGAIGARDDVWEVDVEVTVADKDGNQVPAMSRVEQLKKKYDQVNNIDGLVQSLPNGWNRSPNPTDSRGCQLWCQLALAC